MAEDRAISWNWSEALHGALCCLPAAVILLATDVRLGIGFAIGVLPVALMGVLPSRRQSLQGLLLVKRLGQRFESARRLFISSDEHRHRRV
jgi:hypothetical protein